MRKVSHEAEPPTPALRGMAVGRMEDFLSDHTVPWNPTWSVDTIVALRMRDYDLDADTEVKYP